MMDMMFEIPSKNDVKECLVTEEVVLKKGAPILTCGEDLRKQIA